MKQKFNDNFDFTSAEPIEVLTKVLSFSTGEQKACEVAGTLLNQYGSFSAVIDAPFEELIGINGVSENTATMLKLIMPIARVCNSAESVSEIKFKSIDEIGLYLIGKYMGYTTEKLGILTLTLKNSVVSFDFIAEGDFASVGIPMRNIIKIVLSKKADGVILCHNHPGGVAIPSNADVEVTATVKDALEAVGITLVDHIVLADSDFVSMRQSARYSYIF